MDTRSGARAVRLRGVTKVYDNGVMALGPLDLDVARGEFVALLGPSGCGKSTALRLIAGLSAPSSGTVDVSHQAGKADGRHPIGFVFQEPTLMPWATVGDNVRLPLKLANTPATEADGRVANVLAQVGLAEFANAFPRELSGGMKMRVSLARALVTDPDILLMDEPFAALDEITRFRLNNDLLALWRTLRKTVIFVTHSVFGVRSICRSGHRDLARPGASTANFASIRPNRAGRDFRTLGRICRLLPRGLRRAGAVLFRAAHRMNSLQNIGRMLLPVAVLAAGLGLWELVVRVNDIKPYVLPSPLAVFQTLVSDWPVLSESLGVTLLTTLEGFIAAAVGGVALALLFNQSKWLEYSLFPYAVILQVTPVIAIAPLLLIYLPQQTAVIVCA